MSTVRILLGFLLLFSSSSFAIPIHSTVENLSGDRWQYNYTVSNESSGADSYVIEAFVVIFDLGLFENLTLEASPDNWDSFVIEPDDSLPDDGYLDTLLWSGSGIAPGAMLAGFSVAFDFLGAGTPGSQFFEILDPFTFDTLDDGFSSVEAVVAVPEPSSLMLIVTGLLLITAVSARRRLKALRSPDNPIR